VKRIAFLLVVSLLVGCGGGGGGETSSSGTSPIVSIPSATSITPTSVILNGTVIPNGLQTQAWFEYGTDSALATYTASTKQDVGNGLTSQTVTTTLNGLAAGMTYYFRFCTENSKWYSKGPIASFTTTSLGDPPTVTTFSATSVGATDAMLNGNVNPNGLETTAWFEWGTDSSMTIYTNTTIQSVGSGATSLLVSVPLNSLSIGTTYYFRVAASNSSGTNKGSIASITPSAVPTVTTLAATSVGATTATLNGNVTANGLTTNAWFEYGTDPSLATYTYTLTQSVGSGTTSQSVNTELTGLSTQTTYYYRVAASNISGTSRGSVASFITGAAPIVATLAATSVSKNTATLNGNVNPNGLSTNAWFEWGTDPALTTYSSTTIQPTGAGFITQSINEVLTDLSAGTTYYGRVVASNSAGVTQGSIVGFLPHEPGKFAGPILLEANDFRYSDSPQVAVDKSGNAIVVWSQSDGTRSYVYYNRYSVSSNTWSGAIKLSVNEADAYDPQVSMDQNGNALIQWRDKDIIIYYGIWVVRYSATTQTFGNPTHIWNLNVNSPLIAAGPSGQAITAWQYSNTIVFNWYSAFPEQFWEKKTFVVSDNTAGSYRIAMDGGGNAVVVWKQSDGIRYNIWANQFSATTQTWSAPALIEFNDAGDVSDPELAMNQNGDAIAVWEQSEGVVEKVWANRFASSTQTWSGPTLLETNMSVSWGIRFGAPHVDIDGGGNVMVVWNSFADVYISKYSPTTKEWSKNVISDNTLGPATGRALVKFGVDGNAVVVWSITGNGTHHDLYSRRFSAFTNTWMDFELLEFSSYVPEIWISADVSSYQIGVDSLNNALVVWTQRVDTINYDVWANRTY
jgi:hypothetical protein